MNEKVYVEFLFDKNNLNKMSSSLVDLGDDFILISSDTDIQIADIYGNFISYWRITGKISLLMVSVIKLSDSFLNNYMKISYISSEFKDRYRS